MPWHCDTRVREFWKWIIVRGVRFQDQFEWDINCEDNSPEKFAQVTALDLGLSKEVEVSIAHAIREQIAQLRFTQHSPLPPVQNAFRIPSLRKEFTPNVTVLTD